MLNLSIPQLTLLAIVMPLLASMIAGVTGRVIGNRVAHTVTIASVAIAFVCALAIDWQMVVHHAPRQVWDVYTWADSGSFHFTVGFWVDHLTALMMTVVTFVSLLVHIYSMGYMRGDDGYARFFCYMSLFTFAMLVLVCANNLLVLFFGWEGVGLVSYLLIGFWYQRPSAAAGGFKAFLINRVGDMGLLLGMAMLLDQLGVLDYAGIFKAVPELAGQMITIVPGHPWSVATLTCLLLFMGAMGKSAQVPLHIWLPESMEGPTPISALIHAATMVTAGIYLVARMSPLFELSEVALSTLMVMGATGALFLGLVALVQDDIKRVVAYSTISQLGYMMAANGASAFSAGIFHLSTHACFKALLFLGAGSVICAMHHEQDMRKMGGLWRVMPVTYVCFVIGSCALCAFPPFSGYYSKDAIIEAVQLSTLPGAGYTYVCLLMGAFVTALYTFRAVLLTFHGKKRWAADLQGHVKESPWSITFPLVASAVPSVVLGAVLVEPMLDAKVPWLSDAVVVMPQYNVLHTMAASFEGVWQNTLEAVHGLPFWFAMAGMASAFAAYVWLPSLPALCAQRLRCLQQVLVAKWGLDLFVDWFFVRGSRRLSQFLYLRADKGFIDQTVVQGMANQVMHVAKRLRLLQSGYLYHYVLVLVLGMMVFLALMLFGQGV